MARRPLRDDDQVLRWASHEKLQHDPDTLEIVGFQITAFQIRPEIENCLSTHWIEHFPGRRDEQIRDAARDLGQRVHTNKRKGGAFAVGKVGQIKAEGQRQSSVSIEATLTGSRNNPPHTEVWGIPLADEALQALLATSSWSELVRARDVLDF